MGYGEGGVWGSATAAGGFLVLPAMPEVGTGTSTQLHNATMLQLVQLHPRPTLSETSRSWPGSLTSSPVCIKRLQLPAGPRRDFVSGPPASKSHVSEAPFLVLSSVISTLRRGQSYSVRSVVLKPVLVARSASPLVSVDVYVCVCVCGECRGSDLAQVDSGTFHGPLLPCAPVARQPRHDTVGSAAPTTAAAAVRSPAEQCKKGCGIRFCGDYMYPL